MCFYKPQIQFKPFVNNYTKVIPYSQAHMILVFLF